MIEVLLLPNSAAVTLPTVWCLQINSLVFTNLTHTHVYKYMHCSAHAYSLLTWAETFVTPLFHFLAEAHSGSKGKMGIQQPLSSPILFHLQKTNFSSYLIYKIMSNLAMQQYCTQLSFPFINAGIWQKKVSLLTADKHLIQTPFLFKKSIFFERVFPSGTYPTFHIKISFSRMTVFFFTSKILSRASFQDKTPLSEILAQQDDLRY